MHESMMSIGWPSWLAMGTPAMMAYAIIMYRLRGVVTVGNIMASSILLAFGPVASMVTLPMLAMVLMLTWKDRWLIGALLRAPVVGNHHRDKINR